MDIYPNPAVPNSATNLRRILKRLHEENRRESHRAFRHPLHLIDASTSLLVDLLIIVQDRYHQDASTIWKAITLPDRIPDPDLLCQCAMAGLIDAILATRELAIIGLDSLARASLRSASENADLIACLLGSRTFLDAFRSLASSSLTSHEQWQSLLTPSKLRVEASTVLVQSGVPAQWVCDLVDHQKR